MLLPFIGGTINLKELLAQWSEILRLATSIKRGTVTCDHGRFGLRAETHVAQPRQRSRIRSSSLSVTEICNTPNPLFVGFSAVMLFQ
jgi:hypothetical protein